MVSEILIKVTANFIELEDGEKWNGRQAIDFFGPPCGIDRRYPHYESDFSNLHHKTTYNKIQK
jgi:hypothetical protein